MKIRELLSPNFDQRAAGTKPTILVLHYTGTATGSEAEAVYLDPNPPPEKSKGPVSPHYMIDRDGAIWVSWPKKAAKVPTDITEDVIRAVALPLHLVDVKVCAVDDTWSGLKLVIRREHR